MGRGDMPNEPGDSLFSPKSLLGERRAFSGGGRALDELGAARLPNSTKLRMPSLHSAIVGRREMSSVVERAIAQPLG